MVNKERYKLEIEVTAKELEDAEYGSLSDMEHLASLVTEAAKKQGFELR